MTDRPADPYRQWNGQQWMLWNGAQWLPETVDYPAPASANDDSSGMPAPSENPASTPRRRGWNPWSIGATVAVLVAAAIGGVVLAHHGTAIPSTTAAAGPPVGGKVVFTDDFKKPDSDWLAKTLASGTTFAYRNGAYEISSKGFQDWAGAPYGTPIQFAAATTTATLSQFAPEGAGFGVECYRPTPSGKVIRYEFLDEAVWGWAVERIIYAADTPGAPTTLLRGDTSFPPGTNPVTVTGVCETVPEDNSTRLLMYVNGAKVADFVQTTPVLGSGWLVGVETASRKEAPSTVAFTQFTLRDLKPF